MGVKTNLHMITRKPGRQNCEHLIQLKQNGALHKFEQAAEAAAEAATAALSSLVVEKFLPF